VVPDAVRAQILGHAFVGMVQTTGDTRLPMAASSTDLVAPVRCRRACVTQMTPHLSTPNVSHQRSAILSTRWPEARS
jgi:hypothetical protein